METGAGGFGVDVVDVLAGLRRELDVLWALDPLVLADGESLLGLLTETARLQALGCRQSAAFDGSVEWAADGAVNSAVWVAFRRHGTKASARLRLRLGKALRDMPVTAAAFAAGRLDVEHVEVLVSARNRNTATVAAFGGDEADLVDHAMSLAFHHFQRRVAEWRQRVDVDGAEADAESQRDGRRWHLSQSFESMWFADGVFDPVSGEIIANELARLDAELFAQDWADAKASLGRDPVPGEMPRTAPQRRADAMVEMATRSATAPAGGRRPAPLFTVLVGERSFARVCELASGTVVTPGSVAWWLDQGVIERIVFDGPARVLDVGRRRFFSGALRRAIQVRDRECTHPLCDRPAEHCDIDHLVPYAQGGDTSHDNGRARCGFHNRLRNHQPDPDIDGCDGCEKTDPVLRDPDVVDDVRGDEVA